MEHQHCASMLFTLNWESPLAHHSDSYFADRIDFERDSLPEELKPAIFSLGQDESMQFDLAAGKLVEPYSERLIRQFPLSHFNTRFARQLTTPQLGRFYPKAIAPAGLDCAESDYTPFRIIGLNDSTITADMNHPLARYEIKLAVKNSELPAPIEQHGGSCNSVSERLTHNGPGLQIPLILTACGKSQTTLKNGKIISLLPGQPLTRPDENKDSLFYSKPRLVQHIDDTASQQLQMLYQQLFSSPNEPLELLDLMSSYQSHLPENNFKVCGVGMNQLELIENPQLDSYRVHDLNQISVLPFDADRFDHTMCNLSIEYLTRPLSVMQEVARVTKPGGLFVVTFSDRWFPPKAITLWAQLHPFERVQLVLDYFIESGQFSDLNTWTLRGLPRPLQDKYQSNPHSDPVFALWGRMHPID